MYQTDVLKINVDDDDHNELNPKRTRKGCLGIRLNISRADIFQIDVKCKNGRKRKRHLF